MVHCQSEVAFFEPTCATCVVGSYASLSAQVGYSFLFVYAFHVCDSKGGLYINIKLHFFFHEKPVPHCC